MGNDSRYIHNLAKTLMGQMAIPPGDLVIDSSRDGPLPKVLFDYYGSSVKGKLSRFNSETLGRIASAGVAIQTDGVIPKNTRMAEVCEGFKTPLIGSGRDLLLDIASVVVVAAMSDIVQMES